MKQTQQELQQILTEFPSRISAITENEFNAKPDPKTWSKQEFQGHLIDSAQNNLRRFIIGHAASPPHIIYHQDLWVLFSAYSNSLKEETIQFWLLINQQICRVCGTMPPSSYSKACNTGKDEVQLRTLQWLATDYVKHMKHHLNLIISGSFNNVYP